jgi:hypothetical protein
MILSTMADLMVKDVVTRDFSKSGRSPGESWRRAVDAVEARILGNFESTVRDLKCPRIRIKF